MLRYGYDELGQLVREDNRYTGKSYTWKYDEAGNILNRKTYAYTIGALGTVQNTVIYGYDTGNWGDLLISFNGQSIAYDDMGNPGTWNGSALTWQGRRLMSYGSNTYTYNADGIRTSKTVNGVEHIYHLSGTQILDEEWTENGVQHLIVYSYDASGSPISMTYRQSTDAATEAEVYFLASNPQGDITYIYDIDGNRVVTYNYDAWGNILSISGTKASTIGRYNPFRYRGYYYDTETGFYYVSSRYYDPGIGRFINADAAVGQIGNVQGTNMFTYCFNNPVNMSDPTGNWPKLSTIFKVVAVAAAVVAVAAVCVATAGLATVAVAGGGTMLVATATTTAALGVAATAGKVALDATGAAIVSEIAEKTYDNLPRNHTVYGLQDPSTGKIEYVGRTTDPAKRAAAHKSNPARQHLEMVPLATGLNAIEARGVEQIQMLAHHTINTANKMNNQINGIGPFNRKLGVYMEAGRGALSYLENQISNEILYWTGN